MDGDDRVRFCRPCGRHVFNLSAMTRDEAETLVNRHEGRVCIRVYRRADGTLLTRDCPKGRHESLQRSVGLWARLALFFGLLAGTAEASLTVSQGQSVRRVRLPVVSASRSVDGPEADVGERQ
jgi:hypothetical protein